MPIKLIFVGALCVAFMKGGFAASGGAECQPLGSSSCSLENEYLANAQAERRLEVAYKELLDSLPSKSDPAGPKTQVTKQDLVKVQRIWLRYRNDSCYFERSIRGGGARWPDYWQLACATKRTNERAAELENLMHG